MQNDLKALIEKYKADLMQYHAANPSGGESPRYVAPTREATTPQAAEPTPAPISEPQAPEITEPQDTPEVPIITPIPQSSPGMPVILPGEPQTPAPRELYESAQDLENDDIADNNLDDDEGYLQIRTVTAEGALPLKGALALIKNPRNGELVAHLITDADGLTAAVPVRTVSRQLSEIEGNSQPYDTYDIEVTLDGYYGINSKNVPVFGGITNVQTLSLIPLPEFAKQGEEYSVDTPDYSL